MSELSMASIVSQNQAIVEAEMEGEIVALNAENGMCYGLNSTATRIWRMFAEPCRISDVCAQLMTTYRVDAATCERDVLNVLRELREGGLVRVREAAG